MRAAAGVLDGRCLNREARSAMPVVARISSTRKNSTLSARSFRARVSSLALGRNGSGSSQKREACCDLLELPVQMAVEDATPAREVFRAEVSRILTCSDLIGRAARQAVE